MSSSNVNRENLCSVGGGFTIADFGGLVRKS